MEWKLFPRQLIAWEIIKYKRERSKIYIITQENKISNEVNALKIICYSKNILRLRKVALKTIHRVSW